MSVSFSSGELSLLAVPSLRLESSEDRVNQFIDSHCVDWFIQEVLDPTKRLATSRRLSQIYVDSLTVVKIGFMAVALGIKEIWKNGVPLHDMLENGWGGDGYDIFPRFEDGWLYWTDEFGEHFSQHVFHPGFKGYHLMDSVRNWGFIERYQRRVVEETNRYLEAVSFR